MPMRVDIFHDKKNKLVVYEEMIDGKSYVFIRSNGELVQIAAPIWRKINKAWQEKGWSEKWDMIGDCVPLPSELPNE
jgi:hypothetical protein